jgi:hypothetical protein
MNVRSWDKELKEELDNTGIIFLSQTQQECNFIETGKIKKKNTPYRYKG